MKNSKRFSTRNIIIVCTVLATFSLAAQPFLSNIEHQSRLRVLEGIKSSVDHANNNSSMSQGLDAASVIALVNPQDSLLTSSDNNSLYIGFSEPGKELKNTKCYFHYTQENESTLKSSSVIENSGC